MSEVSIDHAVVTVAVHSLILQKSLRGEFTTLAECEQAFAAAKRFGLSCPASVSDLGFTICGFFVTALDLPAVMTALKTVRKHHRNHDVERLLGRVPLVKSRQRSTA